MSSLHPRLKPAYVRNICEAPFFSRFWSLWWHLALTAIFSHSPGHFCLPLGLFCVLWTVSGLRLLGSQRNPIYMAVGTSAELLGVCVPNIPPTHCRHHPAVNVQQRDSDFDKQGVTRFFLLCHKVFFIWEGWSLCQVHVMGVCLPGALRKI